MVIQVPQNRNGEFESKLVMKQQTTLEGDIEVNILSMYANGMATDDIEGTSGKSTAKAFRTAPLQSHRYMNDHFASALDRPSRFCYRYSQGRKAKPCFPTAIDPIVLRSFGVYTSFGADAYVLCEYLLKIHGVYETILRVAIQRSNGR